MTSTFTFGIGGMAPTINAMVQTAPRKLELAKFARPKIGQDDALVRIEACGMCGSDVELYTGLQTYAAFPFIPGHEPVGIVEEIGEDAARRWGVTVGDRVAIEPLIACGTCEHCLAGRRTTCEHQEILGLTSTSVEPSLLGAYAEYMYLPPRTVVHKVAPHVSAHTAVLFNPLGAGIRWAVNESTLRVGDTVVILGSGQRGLASVIAAKAAGAAKIIVTDVAKAANKLDVARSFGADHAIVVDQQDAVEEVKRLTNGKLADVVVDVTSVVQPLVDAVQMVRRGGTIVIGGVKGPKNPFQMYSDDLVLRSITLKGVFTVDNHAYRQALRMIEADDGRFARFGSQKFPLHQTEEAIHRLAGWDGKAAATHVLIDPWMA